MSVMRISATTDYTRRVDRYAASPTNHGVQQAGTDIKTYNQSLSLRQEALYADEDGDPVDCSSCTPPLSLSGRLKGDVQPPRTATLLATLVSE